MSIIRHKKTTDFAVLRNDILRNRNLTYEARGLLAYLLSRPDDWEMSMVELENSTKNQGATVVRRIVKELEGVGYIKRQRLNRKDGTFYYESEVFETPYGRNPYTVEPHTVEPHTLNGHTKEVHIEPSNTELKKESCEPAPQDSLTLTPKPDKDTRHQDTLDYFFKAFCRVNEVQDMPNMKALTANLKMFLRDHPIRSYPQQRINNCIDNWAQSHPKWHTFAKPWTIILALEKFSKGALDEYGAQIGVTLDKAAVKNREQSQRLATELDYIASLSTRQHGNKL